MAVRFLVPVAAAPLMLAGCYQTPEGTLAGDEPGRISVADQPAGGAVMVDAIGMPSNGWIVLHAMRDGAPDTSGSIGHAYIPGGPSSNVTVPLNVPVQPGQQVAAMLHLDTGVAQVFEFANGSVEPQDPPVIVDGAPVVQVVTLR